MTAAELIEALLKLDPNTLVFTINGYDSQVEPVKDISHLDLTKFILPGENIVAYGLSEEYPPDFTPAEPVITTVPDVPTVIFNPNNLNVRYWGRVMQMQREMRRAKYKEGALKNDDFEPPL